MIVRAHVPSRSTCSWRTRRSARTAGSCPEWPRLRLGLGLARRPRVVAAPGWSLVARVRANHLGTSDVAPAPRDRRFTDPGWSANPLLRRLVQAYLAAGATARTARRRRRPRLARRAARSSSSSRTSSRRSRRATRPARQPAPLPRPAIDTAGLSSCAARRNFVATCRARPGSPRWSTGPRSRSARRRGHAWRGRPAHRGVRADPVRAADREGARGPAADRAPRRSTSSTPWTWRRAAAWSSISSRTGSAGLHDVVAQPRRRARATGASTLMCRRSSTPSTPSSGSRASSVPSCTAVCSGGILAAMTAATSRPSGQPDRLAGLALAVTVLDTVPRRPRRHPARSAHGERCRHLVGTQGLPRRPGPRGGVRLAPPRRPDLELLGQQLPARQEATGLRHLVLERRYDPDDGRPARATSSTWPSTTRWSSPARPHGARHADRPRAVNDRHLRRSPASPTTSRPGRTATRARTCSAATTRFVLSTSGHIAALVNPPGNPKASFQVDDERTRRTRESFMTAAQTVEGTWWTDYVVWLRRALRSRDPGAASSSAAAGCRPVADAPGTYVFDK